MPCCASSGSGSNVNTGTNGLGWAFNRVLSPSIPGSSLAGGTGGTGRSAGFGSGGSGTVNSSACTVGAMGGRSDAMPVSMAPRLPSVRLLAGLRFGRLRLGRWAGDRFVRLRFRLRLGLRRTMRSLRPARPGGRGAPRPGPPAEGLAAWRHGGVGSGGPAVAGSSLWVRVSLRGRLHWAFTAQVCTGLSWDTLSLTRTTRGFFLSPWPAPGAGGGASCLAGILPGFLARLIEVRLRARRRCGRL